MNDIVHALRWIRNIIPPSGGGDPEADARRLWSTL